MANSVMDKAAVYLTEAYAGPGASIFDDLLQTLLDIASSILGDCLNGLFPRSLSQIKSEVDSRQVLIKARRETRIYLRDKYGWGAYRKYEGNRLADAVINACKRASVEELGEFARLTL